ncbi:MAG: ketoacyl-ACP synthase III [Alloprevotella sp.]|nr:ketoacyl-ACP synthase III [Alloprevotella sp.]
MDKIHAAITGVGGYIPEYVLDNDELARMVDTNDEWIMARIGIKERHILNEEGLGPSYMARKAVKQLLRKTQTDPLSVDALILVTTTPDYGVPNTASIVIGQTGMQNAHGFDLNAACCGFLFAMEQAAAMIESGRYQKVVVCASEKMSSIIDYNDRSTCPLFGDGSAAVLVEPTTEDLGWKDSILRTDGKGLPYLVVKGGGSACTPSYYTIDNKLQYLHQEGRTVFKYAVTYMSDLSAQIVARNQLKGDALKWVIPHQANIRIIEAVANRLELPAEKVLINIQKYGNTSSATLPLVLWDFENKLKKGDNILLTAFGAGFTYGAAYLTWAYDPK